MPPITERSSSIAAEQPSSAAVLVLGNWRPGGGKSTIAAHLIAAYLALGYRTASIDLDSRQGTLSRFLDNRFRHARDAGVELPMPTHRTISAVAPETGDDGDAYMETELTALAAAHDFLVIDTPATANKFAAIAHSHADKILTPLGGADHGPAALVDLSASGAPIPNGYSEFVWEQKKRRARRDRGSIDWLVSAEPSNALDEISSRLGFRGVPGLTVRPWFAGVFASGLTVMDWDHEKEKTGLTMGQVIARQEVRALIESIGLPG